MFKRIYICCIWVITIICMIAGLHAYTGGGRGSKVIKDEVEITKELDDEDAGEGTGDGAEQDDYEDEDDDDYDGDDRSDSQDSSEKGISAGEEVKGFRRAEIRTDVLDVEMATGDGYNVTYQCTEKLKPDISVSGGTLHVTQKGKGGWKNIIGFGDLFDRDEKMYVKITVPKGTKLDDVNLSSDVGDIQLRDLWIDNLAADVDTSDIFMKDCTVKTGNLKLDTGDVQAENGSVDQIQIKTDTGDVEWDGCAVRKMDCRTDTGDVEINPAGNLSDYYIQLDTDGGDVEVDGKGQGGRFTQGDTGRKYQITVRTDTGDIDIGD